MNNPLEQDYKWTVYPGGLITREIITTDERVLELMNQSAEMNTIMSKNDFIAYFNIPAILIPYLPYAMYQVKAPEPKNGKITCPMHIEQKIIIISNPPFSPDNIEGKE